MGGVLCSPIICDVVDKGRKSNTMLNEVGVDFVDLLIERRV